MDGSTVCVKAKTKAKKKNTASDALELDALRAVAREVLGEDAKEQEELLCALPFDELLEMLVELDLASAPPKPSKAKKPTSKSTSKKSAGEKVAQKKLEVSVSEGPDSPTTRDAEQDEADAALQTNSHVSHHVELQIDGPRKRAPAASARAGVGARAFSKKAMSNTTVQIEENCSILQGDFQPTVKLDLSKADDSDFEGVGADARAMLEEEITKLCKSVKAGIDAAKMDEAVNTAEDAVDLEGKERHRLLTAIADDCAECGTTAGLSDEQLRAVSFFEELDLKNKLHHKALLYSLTRLETAELFGQYDLEAPKDGDFEIVKQLLSESRSLENSRLRESVWLQNRAKVKMRYVNNELVQTKDKYLLPTKDADFVKNTSCHLTLLGNSSKARREQRAQAEEAVKKQGPVSSSRAPKKK